MFNSKAIDGISVGNLYVNLEEGSLYSVVGFALNGMNAQDGQIMVIYNQIGYPGLYVRGINEFKEEFEYTSEKTIYLEWSKNSEQKD
jgi:hypothetical protein